jgi:hypothetical protein
MTEETTKVHPSQIGGPDRHGRIQLGLSHRLANSPEIPGYMPIWINVNLERDPVKIVTYKPTTNQEEQ